MAANNNNRIGPKRLVVGAAYGLRGWLAQRITAVVMALYTLVLLFWFFGARDFSYDGWASIFAMQWMKLATFVALLSLFYHAWVGIDELWLNNGEPVGLRLFLQALAILWLVGA